MTTKREPITVETMLRDTEMIKRRVERAAEQQRVIQSMFPAAWFYRTPPPLTRRERIRVHIANALDWLADRIAP